MEGWRQRRPGSNARNPREEEKNKNIHTGKEKKRTYLTLTGLLMEGHAGNPAVDLDFTPTVSSIPEYGDAANEAHDSSLSSAFTNYCQATDPNPADD
jgi:hypothetical protein